MTPAPPSSIANKLFSGRRRGEPGNASPWKLAWQRSSRDARKPQRWSRYERLSFFMLFWMFGVMMGVTLALHLFNYNLETKTSSTSGSHEAFYGLHGAQTSSASDASNAASGGKTATKHRSLDAPSPR